MVIFSSASDALAGAAHLRLQLLRLRVHEHDAAAVGLDPLEDQLHDPLQQLVDVQRVADRQGRAVHHLEIAAGAGQPGILRHLGLGSKIRLPSSWRDRMDDPRLVVGQRRRRRCPPMDEVLARSPAGPV